MTTSVIRMKIGNITPRTGVEPILLVISWASVLTDTLPMLPDAITHTHLCGPQPVPSVKTSHFNAINPPPSISQNCSQYRISPLTMLVFYSLPLPPSPPQTCRGVGPAVRDAVLDAILAVDNACHRTKSSACHTTAKEHVHSPHGLSFTIITLHTHSIGLMYPRLAV